MNSIAKIAQAQGLISPSSIPARLTPEQELHLEKRREHNINKNTGNRGAQKNSHKKSIRHESKYDSQAADATLSGIRKEGEKYLARLLSPRYLKILNFFINTVHLKHESAPSQLLAALECGVSLSTIKRALKKFRELGLISWKTYGNTIQPGPPGKYIFRENCVYKIPNFLFLKDVAFKLHKLLSALSYKARSLYKCIAIALLFANTRATYPKISSFSQYEPVSNRYLYKQRISTSKCHQFEEQPSHSPPFLSILNPVLQNLHHNAQISEADVSDIPIPDILRTDITPLLGLTRRGQFYLAMLHEDVLRYAFDQVKLLGNGNRDFDFRLFMNSAAYAITRYNLPPDFEKTRKLTQNYGCDESKPYYYSNKSPQRESKQLGFASISDYVSSSAGALADGQPKSEIKPFKYEKPQRERPTEPDFSNPFFGEELKNLATKFNIS